MHLRSRVAWAALSAGLLLAGCLTNQQLIENRIRQKAAAFGALPAEAQQRVREGRVDVGDPADAAWLAFGPPDRTYSRAFAGFTNEVWSYVWELDASPAPQPALHPLAIHTPPPPPFRKIDEYRRVEVRDGRVVAVDLSPP
jgi:hypothetical protein